MSYVAEISSAAGNVSLEELVRTVQEAQMSVLKKQMDVQVQIQQQLVNMMRQLSPHLGSHVNIAV